MHGKDTKTADDLIAQKFANDKVLLWSKIRCACIECGCEVLENSLVRDPSPKSMWQM